MQDFVHQPYGRNFVASAATERAAVGEERSRNGEAVLDLGPRLGFRVWV